jgi:hypothetical protein
LLPITSARANKSIIDLRVAASRLQSLVDPAGPYEAMD